MSPQTRRINQRAGTGAADNARRMECIERASSGRLAIPSLQHLDPAPIASAASVNAFPRGSQPAAACLVTPRAIVRAMVMNWYGLSRNRVRLSPRLISK